MSDNAILWIFPAAAVVILAAAAWTGRIIHGPGIHFGPRIQFIERSKRPVAFWLLAAYYAAFGTIVWAVFLR